MKSNRFYLIMTVLIIAVVLVACSNNGNSPNASVKEGIQPYNLSENERYLLQSFGMEGNSHIISFNAPKEAISLEVKVYKLGDNKKWDVIGGGGISIGKEREPVNQLSGTFTLQLKENHAIDFNINSSGRASFKTDEIILDTETMASAKGFLQEYQEVEIDKEIPVALMVYDSGTVMKNYSLEDYFEPAKFEGMDLVQVVTLMFVGE
ncbi:MAG TPA: hypothetical protein VK982_01725 [Bacteroidales bacterium]|nr:hypothetical protein [Bacteroidales bacterium]